MNAVASGPLGRASPRSGSAAPAVVAPASIGGSTGSSDTAERGSRPLASNQRPIHPVPAGWSGEAVCQMSIDRKWLWSGFG